MVTRRFSGRNSTPETFDRLTFRASSGVQNLKILHFIARETRNRAKNYPREDTTVFVFDARASEYFPYPFPFNSIQFWILISRHNLDLVAIAN